MHPSIEQLLQWFKFNHLPDNLQMVSAPFWQLATHVADSYEGPEASACLRKLLEAKDCAVRAAISSTRDEPPTPTPNDH